MYPRPAPCTISVTPTQDRGKHAFHAGAFQRDTAPESSLDSWGFPTLLTWWARRLQSSSRQKTQERGERTMLESTATKTKLATKALRHPLRAVRRLVEAAQFAGLSETDEREAAIAFLTDAFEVDARSILDEHALSEFRLWMESRRAELGGFRGPYRLASTPTFDCET